MKTTEDLGQASAENFTCVQQYEQIQIIFAWQEVEKYCLFVQFWTISGVSFIAAFIVSIVFFLNMLAQVGGSRDTFNGIAGRAHNYYLNSKVVYLGITK